MTNPNPFIKSFKIAYDKITDKNQFINDEFKNLEYFIAANDTQEKVNFYHIFDKTNCVIKFELGYDSTYFNEHY